MSNALPAHAATAVTTATLPTWTWMRWADLASALLFAAFGLACAGRSMALMVEIPADTAAAASPAHPPAFADAAEAQPPSQSP